MDLFVVIFFIFSRNVIMQYDHIISNMVYSMELICWYVFTSMGGYIFILLIYIFYKRVRLFLYFVCISVLGAFLPAICGNMWPVIRMSNSFQQCIRHTIFGLHNIKKKRILYFCCVATRYGPSLFAIFVSQITRKDKEIVLFSCRYTPPSSHHEYISSAYRI